jgi:hypothetical protein
MAEFLRRKPPPPALYAAHRHLKVISKMESRFHYDPAGPNCMEHVWYGTACLLVRNTIGSESFSIVRGEAQKVT